MSTAAKRLPQVFYELQKEYQEIVRSLPRSGPMTRAQEERFQDAISLRWFLEQMLDNNIQRETP